MPGGDRHVFPPLELLLGSGRREQCSFSCRLSADPGMPGLRLTLQVGASSQQLPPRAEQKYRFNRGGGRGLTSRLAKREAVFPSCQDPLGLWGKAQQHSQNCWVCFPLAIDPSGVTSSPGPFTAVNHRDLFARGRHGVQNKRISGRRQPPATMAGSSLERWHTVLPEGCSRGTRSTPGCSRCRLGLLGAGRRRLFASAATLPSDAGFLPLAGLSECLSSTSALRLRRLRAAQARGERAGPRGHGT